MIDWWVISSILAGLGTAYGANAYNKKDATELRKKAVELLSQGEGKGWAAKIEELQSKVAQTEADKTKAEEAAAKLQAAIEELKTGIQTQKTALTGQLQTLTSPDEVAWATVDPGTFAYVVDALMTGWLPSRGIQITPTMGRFAMQIRNAPPQARGSLQGFYTALKDASEKQSGGRRRRRGRKGKGGADTPAVTADKTEALAEVVPDQAPLPPGFLDEAPTAPAAPAVEVVPVPPVEAPPAAPVEAPVEAPATEVPAAPVAPSAPPAGLFPSRDEFSAEVLRLVSSVRPGPMPMAMPMAPMPAPLTKKDQAAQKAAQALSEKLTRAWDAAVKEVEPYKAHAQTLAEETKAAADAAYTQLVSVFGEIGTLIPQLTQPGIRDSGWADLKTAGEALSSRLTGALKAYKDAVGSLPSTFLSMFKKAKAEAPAPEVSTARHDAFVASTKDLLSRAEAAPKAIETLRKSIKRELEFFKPPEQFRGGCALVQRARDTDVTLAQSNFDLKEAAPAVKDLKTEIGKYISESKGSRIADSVFPPVAPALPPPPPPPGPAPLSETTRAAVKSRVEEIAEQVKARKAAEDAAERATPRPWNPMIPLPPGPPPSQDGGLFGFSSKPGPVVSDSATLSGFYTSILTTSSALTPVLAAVDTAIREGEGILTELQEMHSKEKAFLRLTTKAEMDEERKSCGYLPAPTPGVVPSSSLEAPAEVVNPLVASRGLKIKPRTVVNVLPAAPTEVPPQSELVANFSRLLADSTPDQGLELTAPAAPAAAPAAPALAPFELTAEPPSTEIVPMGALPPSLGQVEAAAPPGLIRRPSELLRSTTSVPTKASAWWRMVSSTDAGKQAVRDMVRALVDSVKGLPPADRKDKLPALKAGKDSLLQLSAPGSSQTGGDALDDDLEALIQELEATGGRSRKSTFKRRRGGKQNGRRLSRRRKDRSDRSHSHAR
jgi:hypothetical protein